MKWTQRLVIKLLGAYKRFVSPTLPPSCRFVPTCSEYAIEAVSQWGAFCGLGLAFWRVLRCNPFCKGGYDPVPLRHKPMGGNSN